MLEKIDLNQKIGKKEYKRLMPELQNRLYSAQKASWDAGTPIVILFEGWDAAGKGTSIQGLTAPLDPRGFKLYPIRAARTYEKKRPWLWRFWSKLPARGEWAIFDRSWYGRVLVERVENLIPESEWRRAYRDIVDFERTIADDGHVIIKFFLHISKQEQKKRFEKLIKDPLTAWHVAAEDWEHHRRYDEWLLAYEEAFERTDTEWGPWNIVEATDRRYTRVKIFRTIVQALEDRLGIVYEEAGQDEVSQGVSVEEPSGTEPGQEDEDADDEVDAEDAFIDQSAVMLEETPESGDGQPSLISFEEEEKTSTSMAQTTED
jgi:polyphosphate kinase 2 (PPK2 family)